MWEDFDFSPSREIEVLRSMSLIKIVKDNEFWMHDQLRDLGREIVRQENLMNLEERSRLWSKEEVLDAIRTKKMKKVQAMKLELFPKEVSIKSEEIRRFENLRFLRLDGGTFVGNLMDCFPNLRWIYWNASGLKCKLTNMCLKNVVVIEFYFIDGIDDLKLWRLIQEARKLKVLTLCECNRITKTPDLSGCSTLKKLTFMTCRGLRKIDSSIGKLKCLIKLKFGECYQLEGLPEEIGDLQNLEHFSLKNCYGIKGLPDSIYKWKSLRELHLSIQGPVELSAAIRKLGNLEVLWIVADLKGQLPSEIGLLPQLQRLVLRGCNEIRELPALPISLTHLAVSSTSLRVISSLSNLTNLVELDLSIEFDIDEQGKIHTGDLRWIGRLSKLEELRLHLLHVPAPAELASLSWHDQLELSGLNLQPFTQLPSSLSDLTLESFKSIALLSSNLKSLSNLQLIRSQMQEIKLDGLQLPNLTVLCLDYCGPLERFMLSSMTKLKEVSVEDCPKLNEIHIAGVLQSLEKLHINGCESFTRLVYVDIQWESSHESSLILASGVFNELQSLLLQDCPKILGIQVVGALESLKKLALFSCQHLQSLSLSNLKNLKSLCIILCHELRIVEGLDKLEFLNKLSVADCLLLESLIDVSTTQLPNECRLYIGCCPKLRGLKQGFRGYVECFKRYKEEESVPAVSTDPLIIWHPPMVSRAESSAQAQMRVPGKMEELLAPFEEEESVPDALTDLSMFGHPSLVSHAESSAQEQMRVPGKMEELLAPFEYSSRRQRWWNILGLSVGTVLKFIHLVYRRSPGFLLLEDQREEEEDHDAGVQAAAPATGPAPMAVAAAAAAADPAELVGELELQQQHVAADGGRGDVEGCSVHFQGQGGGDREEEDGGLRLHPLPPGSDQGRDQRLGHYS